MVAGLLLVVHRAEIEQVGPAAAGFVAFEKMGGFVDRLYAYAPTDHSPAREQLYRSRASLRRPPSVAMHKTPALRDGLMERRESRA